MSTEQSTADDLTYRVYRVTITREYEVQASSESEARDLALSFDDDFPRIPTVCAEVIRS